MNLPHSLTRTILIEAPRETVFRYFTDSARWASWWGAGSAIDARPGGAVLIRYPNAVEVRGEVLALSEPESIVFTYGYVSGKPVGPGQSQVTIRLEETGDGTRVHLQHDFSEEAARNEHVQGWRYQLAVFTNVVADHVQAGASASADAWYRAWGIADPAERRALLASVCTPGVCFRDRWANVATLEDLDAHIAALQRMMPGMKIEARGKLRHCQGVALSDWAAPGPGGTTALGGTNVFRFDYQGKIRFVSGFPA